MKYPRLQPEDEKAFLDALDAVWSYIGWDCLAATAHEQGLKNKRTDYGTLCPAEQVTLRRSTVIDIVTDNFAGGMYETGRGTRMTKEQYQRIRSWMLATPAHIVDKVVKQRFTYKWYGA